MRVKRVYIVQTKDRQKTDTQKGDDNMTIYTEKAGAFTGRPELEQLGHEEGLSVEAEQLPEYQSDALCRVILGGVARIFEDPAVREDYERWKAARAAKKV